MAKETVAFGKMAFMGILAGLAIALGVPYIVLTNGAQLHSSVLAAITILAVLMGSGITVISTFFGIVIPRKVSEDSGD